MAGRRVGFVFIVMAVCHALDDTGSRRGVGSPADPLLGHPEHPDCPFNWDVLIVDPPLLDINIGWDSRPVPAVGARSRSLIGPAAFSG